MAFRSLRRRLSTHARVSPAIRPADDADGSPLRSERPVLTRAQKAAATESDRAQRGRVPQAHMRSPGGVLHKQVLGGNGSTNVWNDDGEEETRNAGDTFNETLAYK
ncbi:hypothetical protein AAFF_G00000220 [Aldrovandia affinis]|uniref:Uncharacterized protein n=1 Tax=Aldrovandia affinis TaxID=143900 RepID=A0AAD7TD08_9TELE|nr:hypothetical protein AAFF_G00000220 [Aldrovandia affinis]